MRHIICVKAKVGDNFHIHNKSRKKNFCHSSQLNKESVKFIQNTVRHNLEKYEHEVHN